MVLTVGVDMLLFSPVGEYTGADPEYITERVVVGMTIFLRETHKILI